MTDRRITTGNGADFRIVRLLMRGDAVVHATLDDALASRESAARQLTVAARAFDFHLVRKQALARLDGLEQCFMGLEHAKVSSEIIMHCLVAAPGGVDGRDATDKGGRITKAFPNYDAAKTAKDGWTRIESRVVVPAEIHAAVRTKLTPLERLVVIGELPVDGAAPSPATAVPPKAAPVIFTSDELEAIMTDLEAATDAGVSQVLPGSPGAVAFGKLHDLARTLGIDFSWAKETRCVADAPVEVAEMPEDQDDEADGTPAP